MSSRSLRTKVRGGKNLSHHWVSWEIPRSRRWFFRVGVWFCCLEGLKDMLTLFFWGLSEFDCTGGSVQSLVLKKGRRLSNELMGGRRR